MNQVMLDEEIVNRMIEEAVTKRTWVELTDEEMEAVCARLFPHDHYLPKNFKLFGRAVEAKLKERNS
jgi:hypothetical protein